MSGGSFDYQQYYINSIIESIEDVVKNNRKKKRKEDLHPWDYDKDGNLYVDCMYYYNFSPQTIKEFKKGIKLLKEAYVYAHRIDWLLSGDDGEETFHERLKEELDLLKKK